MPKQSKKDALIDGVGNADKNAPYRSRRRAAQQGRAKNSRRARRRIVVRSELREQPDVRKIARAIIAMAMAEAERAAQAEVEGAPSDFEGARQ